MRLLVLQHARIEHPAALRPLLAAAGHVMDQVCLDEGGTLPSLDGYDALWVMGGPQNVWQEDVYPWLAPEKALIREAVVERGMPYLGLCLGHQLLADALGGQVGPGTPEIGVEHVRLTGAGARDPLLAGLPESFEALQWHGAEVTRLPEGARVLAESDVCAVQAMAWGRALGLQFHLEVEPDTVRNWAGIPEYRAELEAACGADAVARLEADCAHRMAAFTTNSARVFANWCAMAGWQAAA